MFESLHQNRSDALTAPHSSSNSNDSDAGYHVGVAVPAAHPGATTTVSRAAQPDPTPSQDHPPAPGRRPWHRPAMHWVRRLHLFSGLIMLPWVLLYGVTAFLFNHPGAFPDRQH